MRDLLDPHQLLTLEHGVIRVPSLVKGRLVAPPQVARDEILAAFDAAGAGASYVKLPQAQVIRLPAIARDTMQTTPDYVYHLLPRVQPLDLIETELDDLAQG